MQSFSLHHGWLKNNTNYAKFLIIIFMVDLKNETQMMQSFSLYHGWFKKMKHKWCQFSHYIMVD